MKILIGLGYTYIGLVLFLTGVNVGLCRQVIFWASSWRASTVRWMLIPVAMVMGYFIVKAEPAVYVLNHQVEEMTDGAISAQAMGMALSIGVAVSLGLQWCGC